MSSDLTSFPFGELMCILWFLKVSFNSQPIAGMIIKYYQDSTYLFPKGANIKVQKENYIAIVPDNFSFSIPKLKGLN